jgi:hypothetical protein
MHHHQVFPSVPCTAKDIFPWPFSVVAETSVEIVWVDAKLFKEAIKGHQMHQIF